MLNDKSILLLEDNREFIDNAVSLFKMFVAQVHVAHTIKEAFDIMGKEKIDIIISDIHLKNENGLDFIKQVRKTTDAIPILVLSGHKNEELLFKAMTLNLSGYLLKPINFKMLVESFNECLIKLEANNQPIVVLKDGYCYEKALKKVTKDKAIFELNKKEILFLKCCVKIKIEF